MRAVLLLVSIAAAASAHGRDVLDMSFGHADHREQNCIVCHHNYVDDTGQGLCIDCHVRDPELRAVFEQQFHDLCRSCHVEERRKGRDAGPTRRCLDCHHAEDAP
jgi:hypothetical protein